MAQITLRIPDSLSSETREIAKAEGVSVNHLISNIVAADVARRKLHQFLSDRASGAPSRDEYLKILKKVPSAPLRPGDEL
ncbi:MAG: hypothetical protein AUJ92_10480 [Armatimonadetes bacterium CG2_30_59_28]|nr:hypothetical protein [Armatimonadota bacterium]OIO94255.1 MAG: hypothetical protein AUJ92_10480 [Armatimonadetes bacterium CG2_30_59_28]PIU63102.1 MAG: hypothetical protein COS85_16675 [Armatimonadetes bacterium CG07_land_8_20_14_0_80_59_28]PIX43179.1 MAG: hypothetical protein COZ56_07830 [Armatimonadetes bacterium CG_4_8_14_3_um_filter_58_9]PIY43644.1 MAG: hypothetical protein COZ05_10380 [Armatimonadetes bacterium CG_4_10_14_3_um_filter_59_10]